MTIVFTEAPNGIWTDGQHGEIAEAPHEEKEKKRRKGGRNPALLCCRLAVGGLCPGRIVVKPARPPILAGADGGQAGFVGSPALGGSEAFGAKDPAPCKRARRRHFAALWWRRRPIGSEEASLPACAPPVQSPSCPPPRLAVADAHPHPRNPTTHTRITSIASATRSNQSSRHARPTVRWASDSAMPSNLALLHLPTSVGITACPAAAAVGPRTCVPQHPRWPAATNRRLHTVMRVPTDCWDCHDAYHPIPSARTRPSTPIGHLPPTGTQLCFSQAPGWIERTPLVGAQVWMSICFSRLGAKPVGLLPPNGITAHRGDSRGPESLHITWPALIPSGAHRIQLSSRKRCTGPHSELRRLK
ncbi:hypothetical protein DFH27DRAFT_523217 [Peziza echinospora]|nr:hypothetical protein DFH27DRAFT_523217 [Peziza echinospora]